jgi:hypothetical protein
MNQSLFPSSKFVKNWSNDCANRKGSKESEKSALTGRAGDRVLHEGDNAVASNHP